MRKSACGLMIALLGTCAALAASQTQGTQTQQGKQTLAGSRWSVTLTPDDAAAAKGTKPFDDVLIFDSAKMTSPECLKYGFSASPYKSAQKKGEAMEFSTTQKSDAEGTSVWTGTIDGDAMNGTMVWTKKDGTVVTYKLSGKRQG